MIPFPARLLEWPTGSLELAYLPVHFLYKSTIHVVYQYTVDGSEIPKQPPGMLLKPCLQSGISTTFSSTGEFTGFSRCHQQYHSHGSLRNWPNCHFHITALKALASVDLIETVPGQFKALVTVAMMVNNPCMIIWLCWGWWPRKIPWYYSTNGKLLVWGPVVWDFRGSTK